MALIKYYPHPKSDITKEAPALHRGFLMEGDCCFCLVLGKRKLNSICLHGGKNTQSVVYVGGYVGQVL